MSRIKGRNTLPEVRLRSCLWGRGHRYRLHLRTVGGRPDLAFVGKKVAVFIDGCFWHGCPTHYVPPRSSREFWAGKLRINVERDQRQTQLLHNAGWRVLRFWEHEVAEDIEAVLRSIELTLAGKRVRTRSRARVVAVEFLDDDGQLERRYLQGLRPALDMGSMIRERSTKKWGLPSAAKINSGS